MTQTKNAVTDLALNPRERMMQVIDDAKERLKNLRVITSSMMKTSGRFSWRNDKGDTGSSVINIFECTSIMLLVRILGYLKGQENDYLAAVEELDMKVYPPMSWCGFSYEHWKNDIEIRIKILTQKDEEEKLQEIINKLSAHMTAEDRLNKDLEDVAILMKSVK